MPQMSDTKYISSRNQLLQVALRPEILPYTIDQEYPIVLSKNSLHYSFIHSEGDQVISHLNLLPRTLIHPTKKIEFYVGLIGNVATDEAHRGKGFMTSLLQEVESHARTLNLKALILWSDLIQFYQNLGYTSFGEEKHFFLDRQKLLTSQLPEVEITIINSPLSQMAIEKISSLRFPVACTLKRSVEDFNTLLTIPDTYLIKIEQNKEICGFFMIGRGYDMAGVIHEWGAQNPDQLLAATQKLLRQLELDTCIILAPKQMTPAWDSSLSNFSTRVEPHHVALAKNLTPDQTIIETLDECFIWGLDSI